MRYSDFKQPLFEGYTIGDIAETLWGAAVTAAFENYPAPAQPADVNRIMASLKNLSYTKTRADGLKSEMTDEVSFVNQIAMKDHVADIKAWPNSVFPTKRIDIVTGNVIKDANLQVKTAGLDLKQIFANGKADKIVIGAQGGADQKGTKVDVAITHSVQGATETIHLGYSLKTNDKDAKLMPVGQNPGVKSARGSGRSVVEFFTDLGIKDIKEPLYDAAAELNKQIKDQFALGRTDQAKILRKGGEVNQDMNDNMAKAVQQINDRVNNDAEERKFFEDLINFLNVHINKGEKGLKLLTIGKEEVYTSTLEKFAEMAPQLKISAKHFPQGQKFFIYAENDETGEQDAILEVRLKTTGGVPSSKNAAIYRNLRYTLTVSTGPGYNKYAKIS
ncbi:MAG: hypothetical protein CMG35_04020 [Candidatus Marinimicrobia bacterium]|jgi:hypothetical protein|nr:hypothetical protein [Candidatus Neomarinimicrobiota bacterium]|tara:strand:- start:9631 stop:10797 length:1167 start_codon:yes stop_codon:yes gene_type:complete